MPSEWLIRLGDGTAESHARAQAALDVLWPYTGELFEPVDAGLVGSGAAIAPPDLRCEWSATLDAVLARATLLRPGDRWMQTGGRTGRHGEAFGHMLAELQYLQRSHPGAKW